MSEFDKHLFGIEPIATIDAETVEKDDEWWKAACPHCHNGSFELDLENSYDVSTKAGKKSKCAILALRCLYCNRISEWRRSWSCGRMVLKLVEERDFMKWYCSS